MAHFLLSCIILGFAFKKEIFQLCDYIEETRRNNVVEGIQEPVKNPQE